LIKSVSDQDLRDMYSILLCDPKIASANLVLGELEIEKLNEKERAYHLNNSAKLQSFDKSKYEQLYEQLKDNFHIFETVEIPDPVLGTSLSYPKASLLIALIKSTLNLRETGKEFSDEQTIKQVELFTSEHSDNDYQIVINGDYLHPLKVSKGIKIWNMFFDLVNNGYLDRNDETQDLYDYLNYNPNNKIITNTHYPRQTIINLESSSFKPNFKSSVQTEKALVQRQNKLKSST